MLRAPRPRLPASRARRQGGFTLIELVVSLAVTFIFFVMALPSFSSLRQRSALRGAADGTVAFWNEARFEAVKRNQMVKVGVVTGANGAFCLGAATTEDEVDATPCDCMSAAPATNACDIARWPANQSEWQGVRLAGVSIAGSNGSSVLRPVVIEPKRSALAVASTGGNIGLRTAPGPAAYRINMNIDQFGHALLCQSTGDSKRLPEYETRRCAD
jgi:prepilin-type N-terminal cleavage/methylation domain-containing protein